MCDIYSFVSFDLHSFQEEVQKLCYYIWYVDKIYPQGLQLTFRNNSSVSSTKNGAFIPSTMPPSMPVSSDSEHVFICTNDNHTLYTVINDEDWTRESSIQGDTESVSSVSSTLESIYTTPMFEIPSGTLNIQLPSK